MPEYSIRFAVKVLADNLEDANDTAEALLVQMEAVETAVAFEVGRAQLIDPAAQEHAEQLAANEAEGNADVPSTKKVKGFKPLHGAPRLNGRRGGA